MRVSRNHYHDEAIDIDIVEINVRDSANDIKVKTSYHMEEGAHVLAYLTIEEYSGELLLEVDTLYFSSGMILMNELMKAVPRNIELGRDITKNTNAIMNLLTMYKEILYVSGL